MTDRDITTDARSAAPDFSVLDAEPFKALNQSHWRAVEELLQGLREGRSILVLTGPPEAGATAVAREAIASLPARMSTVQGRPREGTLQAIVDPLHEALCQGGPALGDDDRPAEQVRLALEQLACEDRGVVYFVDPEMALTDEALVYLARLAAGGRRMTRERRTAREAANAPLRGPVGAQIVLCAPPEALGVLSGLGDSALRRAAEAPIEIEPFDGPALRAAFRQQTGGVLAPGAVEYALAATRGDQVLVEALLSHPILLQAAASAEAADAEPQAVSARTASRATAELGLAAPEDLDPSRLDARDFGEDAPIDGGEPAPACADDLIDDEIEVDIECGDMVDADQGSAADRALDTFSDALDAALLSPAVAQESFGDAARAMPDAAAAAATDPLLIERGAAQPAGASSAGDRGYEEPGEEALLGALQAAEKSLTPESMESAGEDPEEEDRSVADRMLQALGVVHRPSAAERLRLKTPEPARTLGVTRRHALIAASLTACILFAAAVTGLSGSWSQKGRYETADALVRQGAGQEVSADLDQLKENAEALWDNVMSGALTAAERVARGAADSVAPTESASRSINRWADSLFSAREEIVRSELEEALAALPPEEATQRREQQIADALRRAEDHAASGRFTAPRGENGYEALLEAYRLAPSDPRVRGALAALVQHYESNASDALNDESYDAFHKNNWIADRIRSRLPI